MARKKRAGKSGPIQKTTAFDGINLVFTALFALIVIYPFYNCVLVSITPQHIYAREPFMLYPKAVTWESYYVVFENRVLFTGMGVTALITVLGVIYNMVLTLLLAYAFNKTFPLRNFFLYMILFTLYFSGGLIPFYLLIKDLGLMDSLLSMVLPTGVSITYMTVMRKYFAAIPEELEESARLDGASEFTILFRIILPISLPMVVTFCLYYGVERWNEWWYGMLFIKDAFKQPLQLVLRGIIQAAGNTNTSSHLLEAGIIPFNDGIKMASIVITMFPILCVYPFLQKYFVQGLAAGRSERPGVHALHLGAL